MYRTTMVLVLTDIETSCVSVVEDIPESDTRADHERCRGFVNDYRVHLAEIDC